MAVSNRCNTACIALMSFRPGLAGREAPPASPDVARFREYDAEAGRLP